MLKDLYENKAFNNELKILANKNYLPIDDLKQEVFVAILEKPSADVHALARAVAMKAQRKSIKDNLTNSSYNDNIDYMPDDYKEPILEDEAYNINGHINYNTMLKDMLKDMCKKERMFCVENRQNKDSYFVGTAIRIPLNALYEASIRKVGLECDT